MRTGVHRGQLNGWGAQAEGEGAPRVELPGLAPPAACVSPRSLRLSLGLPPSEVRPPVEGVSPSSSEF